MVSSYVNSINDPFEDPGCKLGWGCLVPSTTCTAYLKGTATANADGTLALCLLPNATGMVRLASGLAVSFATTAVSISASDATAIDANYSTGRVISGGIRAYPNIALTSAPGAVYAGAIPTLTFNQSQALTPQDLTLSPFMKQFRSYEGATATLRPQDTFSFEFDARNTNALLVWAGDNDLPVSVPFISFFGIGNGTNVFFEAVLNFEVIAKSQHASSAISTNDKATGKSLSDYFPSVERMWSLAKPMLAAAGRYGAQTALASYYAGGGKSEVFGGKAYRLGNY